jgi:hypothetical protein
MKRTLLVVFTLAALAAAFTFGLYRGIDLGIEEAFKLRPVVIPVPCPTPSVPLYRS